MVTNVKSKLQQLQSINNCNFYKEHNFNQQQNIDEILAALKWLPAKSERLVLYCYKKVWWKRDTGEREIIGKRTKGMMVWLTQLRFYVFLLLLDPIYLCESLRPVTHTEKEKTYHLITHLSYIILLPGAFKCLISFSSSSTAPRSFSQKKGAILALTPASLPSSCT